MSLDIGIKAFVGLTAIRLSSRVVVLTRRRSSNPLDVGTDVAEFRSVGRILRPARQHYRLVPTSACHATVLDS